MVADIFHKRRQTTNVSFGAYALSAMKIGDGNQEEHGDLRNTIAK